MTQNVHHQGDFNGLRLEQEELYKAGKSPCKKREQSIERRLPCRNSNYTNFTPSREKVRCCRGPTRFAGTTWLSANQAPGGFDPKEFRPVYPPAEIICCDTSIVRIEREDTGSTRDRVRVLRIAEFCVSRMKSELPKGLGRIYR